MYSEIDPLLPQNTPSPEISGYGYSKAKQHQPEIVEDYQEEEEQDAAPASIDPSASGASPLSTLIGLFTFVVAVGFLIALLMGGSDTEPLPHPKQPIGKPGLSERVEKILHETPLIGH